MNKEDRNSIIVAVLWAFPSIFIAFWIGGMVGLGEEDVSLWILATIIWYLGMWLWIKIFKWQ